MSKSERCAWILSGLGALCMVLSASTEARCDPMYTITGIAPLPGTSQSIVTAINNKGQVAGTSYNSVTGNSNSIYPNTGAYNSGARNFLLSGGQTTEIGTADAGAPNSINDSGRIAFGLSRNNDAGYSVNGNSYLYNPDGSIKTALGYYDPTTNYAPNHYINIYNPVGINNSGLVAGGSINNGPTVYVPAGASWAEASLVHTTVITDATGGGTVYTLGVPGTAIAINNHGELLIKTGAETSVLDQTGHLTTLANLPGGANFSGVAINNSGQVVGSQLALNALIGGPTADASGNYDFQKAMLYSNGKITDLNSLLPANSGWDLTRATGINDLGQIIGQGTFDGQEMGFVMTPVGAEVPEPGTLAFATLAIVAVAGRSMMSRRPSRRS